MNTTIAVRRPTVQVPESQRDRAAYQRFEQSWLQNVEAELAQNKDPNTQTGPYVRKKLVTQLLIARKNDPKYAQELQQKYPNLAAEIQQAAAELTQWNSPLNARASNNNPVQDQTYWPQPGQIAQFLAQQAQSGNRSYRQNFALDLIARMRLVKNDAYAAIEGAIPQIYPNARLVAARIAPEEYPLLRLELLSLPLADQNRIYYIRNLAIDIQNLMTNNNEGATIRNAVHNAAGPANVPLVGQYLVNYFNANGQGDRPDPDSIAMLMLVRRRLASGDVSAVREFGVMLKRAFSAFSPSLQSVLDAGDAKSALAALDKFIYANVRLAPSTGSMFDDIELYPANNAPVPPETVRLIKECASALEANDVDRTIATAQQVLASLQQMQHPQWGTWQQVSTNAGYWKTHGVQYQASTRQMMTQFLQQAQVVKNKELANLKTMQGQPVSKEAVARIANYLDALKAANYDAIYQNFQQFLQDLQGTSAYQGLAGMAAYFTPQNRNTYNAYQLLNWVNQYLRPALTQSGSGILQGGMSSNANYSAIEVYQKLGELYEEISALYSSKADVEMLERAFPMWAPPSIRESLFNTTTFLKGGDRTAAVAEIAKLRKQIREEVMPHEGKLVRVAAKAEKALPGDGEFTPVAAAAREGMADASAKLEAFLAKRASTTPFGRSTLQVTQLNNPFGLQNMPQILSMLTDLYAKIINHDGVGANALIQALNPSLQQHQNWASYSQTATNLMNQTPPQFSQALYYIDYFLFTNGGQVSASGGSSSQIPPFKPNAQNQTPSAQAMQALQTLLDRCRAGDKQGAMQAWATVQQNFGGYANWNNGMNWAANLVNQFNPMHLVPYVEEFILENMTVSDDDVKTKLTLADGSRASAEAAQAVLDLRAELRAAGPGQENLRLIQLDGLLEDIGTNMLAALSEDIGEVTDENVGTALVALKSALGSAMAGGFGDLKRASEAGNSRLLPFGPDKKSPETAVLPEFAALSDRLDKLMQKDTFTEREVAELRTVAGELSERVWQSYVDLKSLFQPRLDRIQDTYHVADPFFVDNLIKQGPLTHLKALADGLNAWAGSKLGVKKSESGAVLENPKGMRVLSEGRAVLKRIVIADTLKDIPKKVVLDENTLLILGTVGNENISMAGSVVVNRATADGAGAGGQFSHIFVWTRNTGIAGVSFENATEVVKEFQERFADRLAQGEEIYLEANKEGFRMAPVSTAVERGWMKADEKEDLRPGLNTFVRFMVPDGAGKARPDLESIHVTKKKPGKPFLEIEIAYPMSTVNGHGLKQLAFADIAQVGPNGAHADSLVGPKAAVLARARQLLNWQQVVLPGQAMPFGQVQRLLSDAGVIDEIRRLEPSMALDSDGFWNSAFMTDADYRSKQCAAIQDVIRKRLAATLLDSKGPTALAKAEILDPLRANAEFVGQGGKLLPIIARSTSNAEDAADFNAAGKHESKANLINDRQIVEGVIEVIASLFNLEAVETRRLFGVDSRLSTMSVLFQPVAQPDISGVLVTRSDNGPPGTFAYQATRGLFGGVHGDAQIQVAEMGQNQNERRVVVPYQASKMMVLDTVNGGAKEQAVAASQQSAQNLLTPQQETTLYQTAVQLKNLFNQYMYPGQNVDLDIEYMFVNGQLKITQARPLPRPHA